MKELEKLKSKRKKEGFTLRQMAAKIGCTESNYFKKEVGSINLKLCDFAKLCDYVGIELNYSSEPLHIDYVSQLKDTSIKVTMKAKKLSNKPVLFSLLK